MIRLSHRLVHKMGAFQRFTQRQTEAFVNVVQDTRPKPTLETIERKLDAL